MSWHFSRALVGEYLVENSSGGEQCAPSSGNPTPLLFCASDRTTEFFLRSPCGMTLEHSTEDHGAAWLTWFLEASRAKTFRLPEMAQDFPANDPDSGVKWQGLLARYDPASCSWKTPQCSLFADSEPSLETWPRWGSMRNGECWERMPLAQTKSANESGFWPTPIHSPRDASCTMETAIKWDGVAKQDSLSFAVAREEKSEGRHMPHGQLNPPWVEWLMGWPTGWTDLKPLAMDKFREWWRLHGGF